MPTLEGSKVIIVFALAGVLIAVSIVLALKQCCVTEINEGFESPSAPTSCPVGTTSFYDERTNLMCCDGLVNGKKCEGNIVCTFSDNTKYPSCNKIKRYKYNGSINPFVVQMLNSDFVNKFGQGLSAAANFIQQLKSLPSNQVSPDDIRKVNALLAEEKDWYANNKKSPSIDYQHEAMYVIQTLTEIFKNKPLMNNKELINQQIKAQVCKPSDSPPQVCKPCKSSEEQNPTGYVISGTGIKGEIPVQIIVGQSGNNDAVYLAQNNDTIIFKGSERQFSAKGKLDYSVKTPQDINKYFSNIVNNREKNMFAGGEYKVRKL